MENTRELKNEFYKRLKRRFPDAEREKSFDFLHPKDARENHPELFGPILTALTKYRKFKPDEFILHDGQMVRRGNFLMHWRRWYEK